MLVEVLDEFVDVVCVSVFERDVYRLTRFVDGVLDGVFGSGEHDVGFGFDCGDEVLDVGALPWDVDVGFNETIIVLVRAVDG